MKSKHDLKQKKQFKNKEKLENNSLEEKSDPAGTPVIKEKHKPPVKTRYVVFVGNLSFSATDSDLGDHFKKAGDVLNIRLALDKNESSKGFAFVEFKDKVSYEKALSLNHTFLNGRRINVEYTDKSSNKKQIKKKNLKLQALRKTGKLEGSSQANKKRSVRRAKARQAKQKLAADLNNTSL